MDGYRDYPTLVASYVCRRSGIPYAIQARGTMRVLFNSIAAKQIYDWTFGKTIMGQCRLFIASSTKEVGDYASFLGQDSRIRKIYNGVSTEEFVEVPGVEDFRRDRGLSDQLLITYVGRLHPSKGIDTLLRAFSKARCRPRARLVLIGPDEGFHSHLMTLSTDLGIQTAVTFVEALTGKQKLAAYAGSDVVVYATQSESFGMVPVESIMCGTPVIISADCGVRELLEPLGVARVVPYGDVTALALEIDALVHLRAQMDGCVVKAREVLGRLLSWDNVAREYEQAYAAAIQVSRLNKASSSDS